MNTMKMFWSIALLASVIPSVSFAQAGPPPKPASCSYMPAGTIAVLVTLCDNTEYSSVGTVPPNDFKKPADKDGLVGKVVAAAFKMAQGKPCDAYQKLHDYETSLYLLALTAETAKAKISDSKADQLKWDLNTAQGAIARLSCQQ
jgi:hypothetical protein